MLRTALPLMTGLASAALLLAATPAQACEKHAKKAEATEAAQAPEAAKPDAAKSEQGNVLKPVDEILSATCNCGGPSDCTCKKGECKCKKCSKHHRGVQKTELLEPLEGSQVSPLVPQNARYDATAGVFI